MSMPAWADEDIYPDDIGSEDIEDATKRSPKTPFSFSGFIDAVGKAKINKGFFKDDDFQFAIANAEAAAVFYYCPAYSEGANIALAYTETYYGWKENPWFDQTHFHTLTLSLGGFTKRLNRWIWRGQVQVNYDGFDKFDSEYFNYNLLLWGRYEVCRSVGIHMGFFAETGMNMDRIYPVIGFDWQIAKRWKLNAVFPFDMNLQYLFNQNWTFCLAGRTFDSRHRVGPKESHPRYVARYSNFGIEAMIRYEGYGTIANIHAGFTTGGMFKVANEHNHHPYHYHLDPAGYVGGAIETKF